MPYRAFITVLLLLSPMLARCGEVLDRLAATVNGHALLQSDVDEELRYECFASKRELNTVTVEDTNKALNRLIDQELLREQMRSTDFKQVSSEEVEKALQSFKANFKDGAADSWATALTTYELTESIIRTHIQAELDQLRLIDLRLRPSIQIDADSVKAYYEQQLLPKLPAGQRMSLEDATPAIRELLLQQKMNESLESWLEALRGQGQIQRPGEAAGAQRQ
jgi:hypothetical protein